MKKHEAPVTHKHVIACKKIKNTTTTNGNAMRGEIKMADDEVCNVKLHIWSRKKKQKQNYSFTLLTCTQTDDTDESPSTGDLILYFKKVT